MLSSFNKKNSAHHIFYGEQKTCIMDKKKILIWLLKTWVDS